MGTKKNAVLLVVAAVFLVLGLPVSAFAQPVPAQGISLQVSPLPIELTAKPGTSVSSDLRVRNAGSQNERLQIRILKVSADDVGNVHLAEPKAGDELVSWIHFSKTVFDAPAGQWQTINMRVDLPTSAAFGYYFAVEYLRANTQAPQPGQTVARGAVATFVLLNADAPGAKRQASIASFSADKKSYEFLPATFTVKVRSTGNVHVAPHGNIFILKGSKQVGSVEVNSALGNVLPGSARFFSATWHDGFPVYVAKYNGDTPATDKNGKVVTYLKWDFSKANRLRFGHYTAHLVLVYDNGQRDVPMDAYLSFWVIPWRIIGAVLALILLIAGLAAYVVVLRRRLKRAGLIKGSPKSK